MGTPARPDARESDIGTILQNVQQLTDVDGQEATRQGARTPELERVLASRRDHESSYYTFLSTQLRTTLEGIRDVLRGGAWRGNQFEAAQRHLQRGREVRRTILHWAHMRNSVLERMAAQARRPELAERQDQLREIVLDLDRRMTIEEYRQMSLYNFFATVDEMLQEVATIQPANRREEMIRTYLTNHQDVLNELQSQLTDLQENLLITSTIHQIRHTLYAPDREFTGENTRQRSVNLLRDMLETRAQDDQMNAPIAMGQSRRVTVSPSVPVTIGGIELNDANRNRIEEQTGLTVTRNDTGLSITVQRKVGNRVAFRIGTRDLNLPIVDHASETRPLDVDYSPLEQLVRLLNTPIPTGDRPQDELARRRHTTDCNNALEACRVAFESQLMPIMQRRLVYLRVPSSPSGALTLSMTRTNEDTFPMPTPDALLLGLQIARHRAIANEQRTILGADMTEQSARNLRDLENERRALMQRFLASSNSALTRRISIQNLLTRSEHLGVPVEFMNERDLDAANNTREYLNTHLDERENVRRLAQAILLDSANTGGPSRENVVRLNEILLRCSQAITRGDPRKRGYYLYQGDFTRQASDDAPRALDLLGFVSHREFTSRQFTPPDIQALTRVRAFLYSQPGRPLRDQLTRQLGDLRSLEGQPAQQDAQQATRLTNLRTCFSDIIRQSGVTLRLPPENQSYDLIAFLEMLDIGSDPIFYGRLERDNIQDLNRARRENLRMLRSYLTEWQEQVSSGRVEANGLNILQHVLTMRIFNGRGVLNTNVAQEFGQRLQAEQPDALQGSLFAMHDYGTPTGWLNLITGGRLGYQSNELAMNGISRDGITIPLGFANLRVLGSVPSAYDMLEGALIPPPGTADINQWRREQIQRLRDMAEDQRNTWLNQHFSTENLRASVVAIARQHATPIQSSCMRLEGTFDTLQALAEGNGVWRPEDLILVNGEPERPAWWQEPPAGTEITPQQVNAWRDGVLSNMRKPAENDPQYAGKQRQAKWVYERLFELTQQQEEQLQREKQAYMEALSNNFSAHIMIAGMRYTQGNLELNRWIIAALGTAEFGYYWYQYTRGALRGVPIVGGRGTHGSYGGIRHWSFRGRFSPLRPINSLLEYIPGMRPPSYAQLNAQVQDLTTRNTTLAAQQVTDQAELTRLRGTARPQDQARITELETAVRAREGEIARATEQLGEANRTLEHLRAMERFEATHAMPLNERFRIGRPLVTETQITDDALRAAIEAGHTHAPDRLRNAYRAVREARLSGDAVRLREAQRELYAVLIEKRNILMGPPHNLARADANRLVRSGVCGLEADAVASRLDSMGYGGLADEARLGAQTEGLRPATSVADDALDALRLVPNEAVHLRRVIGNPRALSEMTEDAIRALSQEIRRLSGRQARAAMQELNAAMQSVDPEMARRLRNTAVFRQLEQGSRAAELARLGRGALVVVEVAALAFELYMLYQAYKAYEQAVEVSRQQKVRMRSELYGAGFRPMGGGDQQTADDWELVRNGEQVATINLKSLDQGLEADVRERLFNMYVAGAGAAINAVVAASSIYVLAGGTSAVLGAAGGPIGIVIAVGVVVVTMQINRIREKIKEGEYKEFIDNCPAWLLMTLGTAQTVSDSPDGFLRKVELDRNMDERVAQKMMFLIWVRTMQSQQPQMFGEIFGNRTSVMDMQSFYDNEFLTIIYPAWKESLFRRVHGRPPNMTQPADQQRMRELVKDYYLFGGWVILLGDIRTQEGARRIQIDQAIVDSAVATVPGIRVRRYWENYRRLVLEGGDRTMQYQGEPLHISTLVEEQGRAPMPEPQEQQGNRPGFRFQRTVAEYVNEYIEQHRGQQSVEAYLRANPNPPFNNEFLNSLASRTNHPYELYAGISDPVRRLQLLETRRGGEGTREFRNVDTNTSMLTGRLIHAVNGIPRPMLGLNYLDWWRVYPAHGGVYDSEGQRAHERAITRQATSAFASRDGEVYVNPTLQRRIFAEGEARDNPIVFGRFRHSLLRPDSRQSPTEAEQHQWCQDLYTNTMQMSDIVTGDMSPQLADTLRGPFSRQNLRAVSFTGSPWWEGMRRQETMNLPEHQTHHYVITALLMFDNGRDPPYYLRRAVVMRREEGGTGRFIATRYGATLAASQRDLDGHERMVQQRMVAGRSQDITTDAMERSDAVGNLAERAPAANEQFQPNRELAEQLFLGQRNRSVLYLYPPTVAVRDRTPAGVLRYEMLERLVTPAQTNSANEYQNPAAYFVEFRERTEGERTVVEALATIIPDTENLNTSSLIERRAVTAVLNTADGSAERHQWRIDEGATVVRVADGNVNRSLWLMDAPSVIYRTVNMRGYAVEDLASALRFAEGVEGEGELPADQRIDQRWLEQSGVNVQQLTAALATLLEQQDLNLVTFLTGRRITRERFSALLGENRVTPERLTEAFARRIQSDRSVQTRDLLQAANRDTLFQYSLYDDEELPAAFADVPSFGYQFMRRGNEGVLFNERIPQPDAKPYQVYLRLETSEGVRMRPVPIFRSTIFTQRQIEEFRANQTELNQKLRELEGIRQQQFGNVPDSLTRRIGELQEYMQRNQELSHQIPALDEAIDGAARAWGVRREQISITYFVSPARQGADTFTVYSDMSSDVGNVEHYAIASAQELASNHGPNARRRILGLLTTPVMRRDRDQWVVNSERSILRILRLFPAEVPTEERDCVQQLLLRLSPLLERAPDKQLFLRRLFGVLTREGYVHQGNLDRIVQAPEIVQSAESLLVESAQPENREAERTIALGQYTLLISRLNISGRGEGTHFILQGGVRGGSVTIERVRQGQAPERISHGEQPARRRNDERYGYSESEPRATITAEQQIPEGLTITVRGPLGEALLTRVPIRAVQSLSNDQVSGAMPERLYQNGFSTAWTGRNESAVNYMSDTENMSLMMRRVRTGGSSFYNQEVGRVTTGESRFAFRHPESQTPHLMFENIGYLRAFLPVRQIGGPREGNANTLIAAVNTSLGNRASIRTRRIVEEEARDVTLTLQQLWEEISTEIGEYDETRPIMLEPRKIAKIRTNIDLMQQILESARQAGALDAEGLQLRQQLSEMTDELLSMEYNRQVRRFFITPRQSPNPRETGFNREQFEAPIRDILNLYAYRGTDEEISRDRVAMHLIAIYAGAAPAERGQMLARLYDFLEERSLQDLARLERENGERNLSETARNIAVITPDMLSEFVGREYLRVRHRATVAENGEFTVTHNGQSVRVRYNATDKMWEAYTSSPPNPRTWRWITNQLWASDFGNDRAVTQHFEQQVFADLISSTLSHRQRFDRMESEGRTFLQEEHRAVRDEYGNMNVTHAGQTLQFFFGRFENCWLFRQADGTFTRVEDGVRPADVGGSAEVAQHFNTNVLPRLRFERFWLTPTWRAYAESTGMPNYQRQLAPARSRVTSRYMHEVRLTLPPEAVDDPEQQNALGDQVAQTGTYYARYVPDQGHYIILDRPLTEGAAIAQLQERLPSMLTPAENGQWETVDEVLGTLQLTLDRIPYERTLAILEPVNAALVRRDPPLSIDRGPQGAWRVQNNEAARTVQARIEEMTTQAESGTWEDVDSTVRSLNTELRNIPAVYALEMFQPVNVALGRREPPMRLGRTASGRWLVHNADADIWNEVLPSEPSITLHPGAPQTGRHAPNTADALRLGVIREGEHNIRWLTVSHLRDLVTIETTDQQPFESRNAATGTLREGAEFQALTTPQAFEAPAELHRETLANILRLCDYEVGQNSLGEIRDFANDALAFLAPLYIRCVDKQAFLQRLVRSLKTHNFTLDRTSVEALRREFASLERQETLTPTIDPSRDTVIDLGTHRLRVSPNDQGRSLRFTLIGPAGEQGQSVSFEEQNTSTLQYRGIGGNAGNNVVLAREQWGKLVTVTLRAGGRTIVERMPIRFEGIGTDAVRGERQELLARRLRPQLEADMRGISALGTSTDINLILLQQQIEDINSYLPEVRYGDGQTFESVTGPFMREGRIMLGGGAGIIQRETVQVPRQGGRPGETEPRPLLRLVATRQLEYETVDLWSALSQGNGDQRTFRDALAILNRNTGMLRDLRRNFFSESRLSAPVAGRPGYRMVANLSTQQAELVYLPYAVPAGAAQRETAVPANVPRSVRGLLLNTLEQRNVNTWVQFDGEPYEYHCRERAGHVAFYRWNGQQGDATIVEKLTSTTEGAPRWARDYNNTEWPALPERPAQP